MPFMKEHLLISLIGMSGSGKSYWSSKLQERGFERFCCDDMIEERLGEELKVLGYSGIGDVARWMGQPFEPQYSKTSKRYLDFEGEVVREVLEAVEQPGTSRDIVIDTTGSVIYLADAVLQRLRTKTRIVYLATPDSVKEQMYKLYLEDPKPVIWGDSFSKEGGETDTQALARCYPLLLKYRTARYERLAHITFDYDTLHSPDFGVDNFIDKARKV